MEAIKAEKADMVQQIKKDLNFARKTKERSELKELRERKRRRDSIMAINSNIRTRKESVLETKQMQAKMIKDVIIREEVQRISRKDQEARRLEKTEEKIVQRLR